MNSDHSVILLVFCYSDMTLRLSTQTRKTSKSLSVPMIVGVNICILKQKKTVEDVYLYCGISRWKTGLP